MGGSSVTLGFCVARLCLSSVIRTSPGTTLPPGLNSARSGVIHARREFLSSAARDDTGGGLCSSSGGMESEQPGDLAELDLEKLSDADLEKQFKGALMDCEVDCDPTCSQEKLLQKNERLLTPEERKIVRRLRKQAAKDQKQTRKEQGRKCCDRCQRKEQEVLIRCSCKEWQGWKLVCGKCWKDVGGGVVDGDADHPDYRYGGLWRFRKGGEVE